MDRSKEEYIHMKRDIMDRKCTFKPKLNKLSQRIVNSIRQESGSTRRSGSGSRTTEEVFNKLYEDSKQHKKRLKAMTKKLLKNSSPSFKHSISSNKTSKQKDFESKNSSYLRKLEKHRKDH